MRSDALKKYDVVLNDGQIIRIEANFAFNNDGDLVFRVGKKGDSEVVGTFAKGAWAHSIKVAE